MDDGIRKVNEKHVVLLKSPKEGDGGDPYEKVLGRNGFTFTSIPVLEFVYNNVDEYTSLLSNGDDYSAIIFTSQQAVKSTEIALQSLSDDKIEWLKDSIPCFVVGKATSLAVKQLGFKTLGEDAGNAEILSDIIVKKCKPDDKPLLYPCGNIRKDTLPNKLKENNVMLREITVYETSIRKDLELVFRNLTGQQDVPEYLVYFSPSGVKATVEFIKEEWFPKQLIKIIAVGPSTDKEFKQHGIDVYAVMEKPEPDSLLQIISRKDDDNRS